MTGEYNTNLLNWLTGNFTTTTPSEVISQEGETETTNALKQYLADNYTTTNCVVVKNVHSVMNGNTLTLLYDQDNSKSIIVIFDSELVPVQLITGYASGTQFNRILTINVGEDGNFFLIENTGSNIRFVMCNNITAEDITGVYKVVLRKAYNVGGNLVNLMDAFEIIKYPNLSKYLVIGSDTDMTPSINIATEIVIQVGAENEYNDFTFDTAPTNLNYLDMYYTLDGENIRFCIAASGSENEHAYNELKNTEYSITTSSYALNTPSLKAVKSSYTDAYLITYDWNDYNYYFYHFSNGTNTLLGSYQTDGGTLYPRIQAWYIGKINDIIYGIFLGDYDSNNYQIRGFTIVNDNLITSGLSEGIGHSVTYFNMIMTATNNYDLYNFIYAFGDLTTKSYVVYNESRYNGISYIDYNFFIPSYARISDGTKPIFARSLYNFTILNDTSTAIVNVPNVYLNDVSFRPNLYGETGGALVYSTTAYQKNIYENVLINFNNSINITNDGIYMQTPSIRLNQSVLNYLDYENAKLGYIRINYANSTIDEPITMNNIHQFLYRVSFYVNAGEDINNIMLLSNDKQTVYDTFNIEYTIGKTYKIERDIYIS